MKRSPVLFLLSLLAVLAACGPQIPRSALQLSPDSFHLRQLQTRRFDTRDEKTLLSASAAVLQDLGFNLDESEASLGVLVASKRRDATDAMQIAGSIALAILLGSSTPTDTEQHIRASIVTRSLSVDQTACRITFQRVIWNNHGQISRTESIEDPLIYREFFEKLSKAVFLEAHNL